MRHVRLGDSKSEVVYKDVSRDTLARLQRASHWLASAYNLPEALIAELAECHNAYVLDELQLGSI